MIEVAIGIVLSQDWVLLTRRPRGAHLEGLWEFPGGKITTGETPPECACREVKEETGLDVEVSHSLMDFLYAYPDRTVHLHFLECHPVGGSLDSSLQEARWLPLSQLSSLEMPPANAPVIQMLIERKERT